jgi:hypothetical protein
MRSKHFVEGYVFLQLINLIWRRGRYLELAMGLALCSLLAGCGSATHAHIATRFSETRFDPKNFPASPTHPNKWWPLTPGLQWVREGTTLVGHRPVPHRVIATVTNVWRQVNGVRADVVLDQDIDAGQTAQESLDYLAQDKQGNVWVLGGYTELYEGGRFVTNQDSWLAGVHGGQAGILMPANPATRTTPWSIARPPSADSDAAEVVKRGVSKCVPYGCFKNVLVIREGKSTRLDNEFKYYAPGVGLIFNFPRSMSVHKDHESVVNITNLSQLGLAALDAEALRLDNHARVTKPSVFARSTATVSTR